MVNNSEIWGIARDLIGNLGAKGAEREASRKVDEAMQKADFVQHLIWRRILKAVRGVNSMARPQRGSPVMTRPAVPGLNRPSGRR